MKMKDKYPHLTTKDFQYLNSAMRRLTLMYSQRKEVFNRIKKVPTFVNDTYKGKARFFYKCEHCGDLLRKEHIEIDHIEEVCMSECEDFNDYMEKMLPDAQDLQGLCGECHNFKNVEDELYGGN